MENWLAINAESSDFWVQAAGFMAALWIKSVMIMAIAALAVLAMRRAPAAARHLVLTLAFGGVLVLPLISGLGPNWQWSVNLEKNPPPNADTLATGEAARDATGMSSPGAAIAPPPTRIESPRVDAPAENVRMQDEPRRNRHGWASIFLIVWFAFALRLLRRQLQGILAARRIARGARPLDGEVWRGLAREAGARFGLRGKVRLAAIGEGEMPMIAGIFCSTVLLPADAGAWDEAKKRAVLLHELAHQKRRDCLTQAVAEFAAALHWFNPLVWWGLRRMRIERERACDDLVLASGTQAAEYAEHLLQIAREARGGLTPAAAIPMAQGGELERRLTAILDGRNRARLTRGLAFICCAAAAAVLLPMAAVRVRAQGAGGKTVEVCVWTAIIDESLARELQGLAGRDAGKGKVYAGRIVASDALTGRIKQGLQSGEVFVLEDKLAWLEGDSQFGRHLPFMETKQSAIAKDTDRIGEFLIQSFYNFNKSEGEALLTIKGAANARLRNSGPASNLPQGWTGLSDDDALIFEGKVPAGQALIQLAAMEEEASGKPYHLIVMQAVETASDMGPYLRGASRADWWIERGQAWMENELRNAHAWANTPAAPSDKGVVRDSLGNEVLRVVAIGQPGRWPFRWWDIEGRPKVGAPGWEKFAQQSALALAFHTEHAGSVHVELKVQGPVKTEGSGIASSSDFGDASNVVYATTRENNGMLGAGSQADVIVKFGEGAWTEIGSIREGERLEADGGKFFLESVETRWPAKDRWFGPDEAGLSFAKGEFSYEPGWEVVLVAENAAGVRTDAAMSRGGGMFDRKEGRKWHQFVHMGKETIARFVILKRPVREIVIEDLPIRGAGLAD